MDNQVEEIKRKVDIVSLISEYVPLKKAGRNYKANCPFHQEKTPSFMVSPELQIFKCFGCQKSGDVFAFLQEYEGMEFYEALKFLAQRVGIKLISRRPEEESEREKIIKINSLVKNFYHWVLLNHKLGAPGLKYLTRERGMRVDTIKKFELGFSPTDPGHLVNSLINKRKFKRDDLIATGTFYPRGTSLSDRFNGRIIFPLFDHRGSVIGFAGRILPEFDKGDTGKYINSPDTPSSHKSRVLYGLNFTRDEIKKSGFATVVEGELDLISLWQSGIANVVAIKGTAMTTDHIDLISRFTSRLVLFLDSDSAGDSATKRGIFEAYKKGLDLRIAQLRTYKDPDDAVRANKEIVSKAIDEAVNVWDFFINNAVEKYGAETGEGKTKISREVVPILASIPDKIVQAHYIEALADKLGVPRQAVYQEVEGSNPALSEPEEKTRENAVEKGRREIMEEEMVGLLLRFDKKKLLEKNISSLIKGNALKRIVETVLGGKESQKVSLLYKEMPEELREAFSSLIMKDYDGLEGEAYIKRLSLVLKELRIFSLKEDMGRLSDEISSAEKSGDEVMISKLNEEFALEVKKLGKLEEN